MHREGAIPVLKLCLFAIWNSRNLSAIKYNFRDHSLHVVSKCVPAAGGALFDCQIGLMLDVFSFPSKPKFSTRCDGMENEKKKKTDQPSYSPYNINALDTNHLFSQAI